MDNILTNHKVLYNLIMDFGFTKKSECPGMESAIGDLTVSKYKTMTCLFVLFWNV